MVKILGLTHPAPLGYGYPKGEDWPLREIERLQDDSMAFYVATGEIFNPHEKHPGRDGHQSHWWFIETMYHPIYDKHGKYVAYTRSGSKRTPTREDRKELDRWLGLLD
jgi:hypothetical protein